MDGLEINQLKSLIDCLNEKNVHHLKYGDFEITLGGKEVLPEVETNPMELPELAQMSDYDIHKSLSNL